MPEKELPLANPFGSELEQEEHKARLTTQRLEETLEDLKQEVSSLEENNKSIYLSVKNMGTLSGEVTLQVEEVFKKEIQEFNSFIEKKLDQIFSTSEQKVQNFVYRSEDLIRKNRWFQRKRQWLMTGAFCAGCLTLSLGLIYFIPAERITQNLHSRESLALLNGMIIKHHWDLIPKSVQKILEDNGVKIPEQLEHFSSFLEKSFLS